MPVSVVYGALLTICGAVGGCNSKGPPRLLQPLFYLPVKPEAFREKPSAGISPCWQESLPVFVVYPRSREMATHKSLSTIRFIYESKI
jgi:hypothetical protein